MITLGMPHDIRWEPVTIFSVGTREAEFTRWLIQEGVRYKQLQGCCFGPARLETSFLVLSTDYDRVEAGGWVEGQEAVLELSAQEPHKHGRRRARLVVLDGSAPPRDLGYWTSVTKAEALVSDYWTYDPATHDYWVTKDEVPKPERFIRFATKPDYNPYKGQAEAMFKWLGLSEGNISDA
jgi:hypothetical protein